MPMSIYYVARHKMILHLTNDLRARAHDNPENSTKACDVEPRRLIASPGLIIRSQRVGPKLKTPGCVQPGLGLPLPRQERLAPCKKFRGHLGSA